MRPADHNRTGHHPETERDVLGAMIRHPERAAGLMARLHADSFFGEHTRALYLALRARLGRSQPIGVTSLADAGLPVELGDLVRELNELDYGYRTFETTGQVDALNRLADLRALRDNARQLLADALEPGDRHAGEIIAAGQEAVMRLGTRHANGGGLVELADGLDAFYDAYDERARNPGRLPGLPTGICKLDEVFGGLMPGDLTIVAARPSMGKTAFALGIAEHLARNVPEAGRSLIYSMEMSREKLMGRLISSMAELNARRLKMGQLHRDELDRFHDWRPFIKKLPIKIDATGSIDIGTLCQRARHAAAQGKVAVAIVDYIQIMGRPGQRDSQTDTAAIQQITSGLKALAMALNIHVIALSQLNRESEKQQRRPRPADLRDSGAIEQDADNIIFIHREGFNDAEVLDGTDRPAIVPAELIVAKQRDGERGVIVPVGFRGEFTRFVDEVPAGMMPAERPVKQKRGLAAELA